MTADGTHALRRAALVLVDHGAAPGSPPGVAAAAFARACLADTYEVLADLVEVTSGLAGGRPELDELLWPSSLRLPGGGVRACAEALTGRFDELVVVPADVPDLPGLVVAKAYKALQRADVCVGPERGGGGGCAVLAVRLPWPAWLPADLDLDRDPTEDLRARAPSRARCAVAPDWHRLRTPAAVQRLDPRLEGWEETRALLGGRALDVL